MAPNVYDIIKNHVTLSVTCIDRLYVNGYIPTLQNSAQLCYFLKEHLGYPIPSPALFAPMHDRFVRAVGRFAQQHRVPVVQFERGQRKDAIGNEHRARFQAPEGVVFVGVAQEKASSFKAQKRRGPHGGIFFDFSRQPVAVNHYYFYVQDRQWGPAILKLGTYLPYPVKLILNGHEWVKQQLRQRRMKFESLDNGFLCCSDPSELQQVCDSLAPAHVQDFFDRWSKRLPWPLTSRDRLAGFDHRLALWQVEVSLTQVFNRPVQGRHFFEEVIRDNLDLGRPSRVSLLFPPRSPRGRPTRPPAHGYRTRVITDGVNPSLHIEYHRSHVKQYFKDDRALRTETTINDPADFKTTKAIDNLGFLRNAGATVNRKLLEVERIGQNCALTQDALDRLQRPTEEHGQRAPALRFGDARVMALLQALTAFALLPSGFRNRDLRPRVAALLGLSLEQYSPGRMTYDLRRLRLKGIINPFPGSSRYVVTTYGLKVALFFSKVYLRIVRPGWCSLQEPQDDIPRALRAAMATLDTEINRICEAANLRSAA